MEKLSYQVFVVVSLYFDGSIKLCGESIEHC